MVMRKSYTPAFKARVALEAIKEQKTLEELSGIFQVAVAQITRWKKKAKDNLTVVFNSGKSNAEKEKDDLIERLYRELGKLQVEHEWLKKKVGTL